MKPATYRRALADYAREHGWSVAITSGTHLRLTHPKSPTVVHAAYSPSDKRAFHNARAMLRRVERSAQENRNDD